MIELVDGFETKSSFILFIVLWSIWAQLEASQGPSFFLIEEVWGQGLCIIMFLLSPVWAEIL